MITAANLNAFLDDLALGPLGIKAAEAQTLAAGSGMNNDLVTVWTDLAAINALAQAVINYQSSVTSVARAANDMVEIISRLNTLAQQQGLGAAVTSLETWLTYLNTGAGGPNAALQHPAVRFVEESLNVVLDKGNYYFPVTQPNHVGSKTAAAFTAGTVTVDQTKYAGGRGVARMISYTAPEVTVTVTGTAWDPATKTFVAAKTWVNTGGSFTGVGIERDLVPGGGSPAPANSLLVAVSAISNLSAGNRIDIQIYPPTGRPRNETWS